MRRAFPAFLIASAVLAASGCGGTKRGSIQIEVGEETDTFTRAPAPTTLVVASIDLDRNVKELARSPLPQSTIDVGEAAPEEIGAIRVTGLADDGRVLVKGESLYVQFGALAIADLPVFVQRTGELARLPRAPSFTAPATAVTLANGRYLAYATDHEAGLYDMLFLRSVGTLPTLPRPARSLATSGTTLVVVDEQGASTFDLSLGSTSDLQTPQGGTFAEVAGGLTIYANDGTQFVVGATRTAGAPTSRILRIGADGDVTFVALAGERLGACASWVEGRGLVVWGGSATAPGGELLGPAGTVAVTLPYPPDPVVGCGAATLDAGRVVVAGGTRAGDATQTAREIDLACAGACAVKPWIGDIPLVKAEGALAGDGAALFVGDDASGVTRAFRASATEVREIATRVPRRAARTVTLPAGGVLVVGGAPGIEQYVE